MQVARFSKRELGRVAVYSAVVVGVIVLLTLLGVRSLALKVIVPAVVWQFVFPRLLGLLGLAPRVEGIIAKVCILLMLNRRDWLFGNTFDSADKPTGDYAGRYTIRLFALGPLHILSFRAPRVALEMFHQADAELDAERQVAPIIGQRLRILAVVARRGASIHYPPTATILASGHRLQATRTRAVRLLGWLLQAEWYREQA